MVKANTNIKRALIQYLLLSCPFLVLEFLIFRYGVNVPLVDEWMMGPLFLKMKNGELTFFDLWAQHNDHRMFFPKILFMLIYQLSDYNVVICMALSQIFILAAVLLLKYSLSDISNSWSSFFYFIPVCLLFFTLRAHENIFWGFQLAFLMACAFPVMSFSLTHLAIKRSKNIFHVFALLTAVIGSFSSAQGLIVWPISIFILVITFFLKEREKKIVVREIILYASFGIISCFLYFFNYSRGQGDLSLVLAEPLKFIEYYLGLISFSLFDEKIYGGPITFLSTILLIYLIINILKNKKLSTNFAPVALILFSLSVMFVITYGRFDWGKLNDVYGTGNPQISRYVSFTVLLSIGIYLLLTRADSSNFPHMHHSYKNIAAFVIVYSVIVGAGTIIKALPQMYEERNTTVSILREYNTLPDAAYSPLGAVSKQLVDPMLSYSENKGLSIFKDYTSKEPPALNLSTLEEIGSGFDMNSVYIEYNRQTDINGRPLPYIRIYGAWAVDFPHNCAASEVWICIDNALYRTLPLQPAQGVVDAFANDSYLYSLIPEKKIQIPFDLYKDKHEIYIVIRSGISTAYYRSVPVYIEYTNGVFEKSGEGRYQ